MITETVVSWATDLWAWFLGLFDNVQIPDFAMHPPSAIKTITQWLDGFSICFPWTEVQMFIVGTVTFVMACFLVRAIRAAVGHLPFIGGNG